jgi:sec-independent protein translocase protein TatA
MGKVMDLGAPELIIILIIVLLVFGGAKLPKLARSLGQAQKEFKTGLKEGAQMDEADDKPVTKSVDKPSDS